MLLVLVIVKCFDLKSSLHVSFIYNLNWFGVNVSACSLCFDKRWQIFFDWMITFNAGFVAFTKTPKAVPSDMWQNPKFAFDKKKINGEQTNQDKCKRPRNHPDIIMSVYLLSFDLLRWWTRDSKSQGPLPTRRLPIQTGPSKLLNKAD